jgi:transcriptional regulator with XRE-family HTH domain
MNSLTTEQVASHLAQLRRVMGLGVSTLATRAQLEPQVVADIEIGTREWTLDELLAIALGLGVTITSIFRRFDPPTR